MTTESRGESYEDLALTEVLAQYHKLNTGLEMRFSASIKLETELQEVVLQHNKDNLMCFSYMRKSNLHGLLSHSQNVCDSQISEVATFDFYVFTQFSLGNKKCHLNRNFKTNIAK